MTLKHGIAWASVSCHVIQGSWVYDFRSPGSKTLDLTLFLGSWAAASWCSAVLEQRNQQAYGNSVTLQRKGWKKTWSLAAQSRCCRSVEECSARDSKQRFGSGLNWRSVPRRKQEVPLVTEGIVCGGLVFKARSSLELTVERSFDASVFWVCGDWKCVCGGGKDWVLRQGTHCSIPGPKLLS